MTRPAALGVFAKEPVPGRVKTRLAAGTSPAFAARAADAFLRDTLDRLAELPAERFVAFAPPEGEPYFRNMAAGRYRLEPQAAGDLGTRLRAFCERRFDDGFRAVVLVGADSPTLPPEYVIQAFERLAAGADVVLGPADDGGYYLLGLGRPAPVFDGIAWSTDAVFRQTVAQLASPDWHLDFLPVWYDVDTPADLDRLRSHVTDLCRLGVPVPTATTILLDTAAVRLCDVKRP